MYHIAFHLGWLPPSMMVGNHLYPKQYTRVAAGDYRGCCSKFQLFLGKSWVSNKDILNLMEEGYNRANCWFSQLETKKWRRYWKLFQPHHCRDGSRSNERRGGGKRRRFKIFYVRAIVWAVHSTLITVLVYYTAFLPYLKTDTIGKVLVPGTVSYYCKCTTYCSWPTVLRILPVLSVPYVVAVSNRTSRLAYGWVKAESSNWNS